jgi:hypothetical protein
LPLLGRIIKA